MTPMSGKEDAFSAGLPAAMVAVSGSAPAGPAAKAAEAQSRKAEKAAGATWRGVMPDYFGIFFGNLTIVKIFTYKPPRPQGKRGVSRHAERRSRARGAAIRT